MSGFLAFMEGFLGRRRFILGEKGGLFAQRCLSPSVCNTVVHQASVARRVVRVCTGQCTGHVQGGTPTIVHREAYTGRCIPSIVHREAYTGRDTHLQTAHGRHIQGEEETSAQRLLASLRRVGETSAQRLLASLRRMRETSAQRGLRAS